LLVPASPDLYTLSYTTLFRSQHRSLNHVIFQAAIDQRRGDRGHRFHRVSVRCDARDFLFHEMKIAERLVELLTRVRVFDRELERDRKSTRLNSSHRTISYAVF